MGKLAVVAAAKPTALDRLVEEYLVHCRARGLSSKTVNSVYGYTLRQIFLPYCRSRELTEPAQVTKHVLEALSVDLLEREGRHGAPMSRHSVHSYLRSVNAFLRWAHEEGEAPAVSAPLPKVPKKLLEILSRDEIDAMEHAARAERDKLIIRVLADSGIRVGELVGLRLSDLVERTGGFYIRVEGKGARERLVPVTPALYRRLRRQADRGRPADTSSDRIFIGLRRGLSGDYEALTTGAVEHMIKDLAERAGIERRVYPHLLRHSFATWMLSRGVNPIVLAQILGHNSLAMIQQVYAHLTPQDSYDALLRAISAQN